MAWVPQHFLPLKMVGFPSSESPNFQGGPIFRGKLAVSFRECIYTQVFSDQFGWIHATCCGWFGRQYAANTFRFLTSSSKHIVGHVVLAKIYVDVLMGWCGLFISLGGGFIFFMFTPTWGNDWIWLIFFNLCWNHHVTYFLSFFHIRDVTSKPIGSMVAWYFYVHFFDFIYFFMVFMDREIYQSSHGSRHPRHRFSSYFLRSDFQNATGLEVQVARKWRPIWRCRPDAGWKRLVNLDFGWKKVGESRQIIATSHNLGTPKGSILEGKSLISTVLQVGEVWYIFRSIIIPI